VPFTTPPEESEDGAFDSTPKVGGVVAGPVYYTPRGGIEVG